MIHKYHSLHLKPAAEALNSSTGPSVLPEIIWNFSHFQGEQRITLTQNPYFYGELPTSPAEYVGGFNSQPVERYEGTIDVLTNNSRRVFLEIDENLRAFDNVWTTNDTLIFKGWALYLFPFPS